MGPPAARGECLVHIRFRRAGRERAAAHEHSGRARHRDPAAMMLWALLRGRPPGRTRASRAAAARSSFGRGGAAPRPYSFRLRLRLLFGVLLVAAAGLI